MWHSDERLCALCVQLTKSMNGRWLDKMFLQFLAREIFLTGFLSIQNSLWDHKLRSAVSVPCVYEAYLEVSRLNCEWISNQRWRRRKRGWPMTSISISVLTWWGWLPLWDMIRSSAAPPPSLSWGPGDKTGQEMQENLTDRPQMNGGCLHSGDVVFT